MKRLKHRVRRQPQNSKAVISGQVLPLTPAQGSALNKTVPGQNPAVQARTRSVGIPASSPRAGQLQGGAASPGGTPQVMPLATVITTVPDAAGYVTVGYRLTPPIWTTDGAAVPQTQPGRWGQLAAAGRP